MREETSITFSITQSFSKPSVISKSNKVTNQNYNVFYCCYKLQLSCVGVGDNMCPGFPGVHPVVKSSYCKFTQGS